MQPEISRDQLAQQRAERAKATLHEALERARKASYAANLLAARNRARQEEIRRLYAK